ncbi:MAG TPA: cupin domain-containing protein [Solirubrobacteraceae bacterium]|nr:cupin domain-containing protein [Solirubrobacteraceae bacterium]
MEFWQLDSEPVEAHAPRVLRSDDDANRIILLLLPEGESLADHQVHEHALVVVLDGEVLVRAGDEEERLGTHGLVHFEPAERHEVQALSDARLLICLAPWPGAGHPSRAD